MTMTIMMMLMMLILMVKRTVAPLCTCQGSFAFASTVCFKTSGIGSLAGKPTSKQVCIPPCELDFHRVEMW